jgi:hypothetical protein
LWYKVLYSKVIGRNLYPQGLNKLIWEADGPSTPGLAPPLKLASATRGRRVQWNPFQILIPDWQCICYFWGLAVTCSNRVVTGLSGLMAIKFPACEVSDYHHIHPVDVC